MSRFFNNDLYVPYGKEEEAVGYKRFAAKLGLPPVRNMLICAASSVGFALLILLILFATGMRFKKVALTEKTTVRYFGWVSDGQPTLGKAYYSDGTVIKYGGGNAVFSTGEKYSGNTLNFLPDGQGTMLTVDGGVYTGEFSGGKFNGTGKLTLADGASYDGQFKDGKYSGSGTLCQSDGSVYTGSFENGEFSGVGKMTYFNGDSFEGTFVDGMRSEGIYRWSNGESISGKFKNNSPDSDSFVIYTDASKETFKAKIVGQLLIHKSPYSPPEGEKPSDGAAG